MSIGSEPPRISWYCIIIMASGLVVLGVVNYLSWRTHASDPSPDPETLMYTAAAAVVMFLVGVVWMKERARMAIAFSERLSMILDGMGEGLCSVDAAGRIVLANPAAHSILRSIDGSLIGKQLDEFFITPEPEGTVLGHAYRAAADRTLSELALVDRDGEKRCTLATFSMISGDSDQEEILVVFRDITDRKRAEEQVRRLSHQKQVLLAEKRELSIKGEAVDALREQRHDLLNELALISAYVQVGRSEEALRCIEFSAASLSDRYHVPELPRDAWARILELKKTTAKETGVHLEVSIDKDFSFEPNAQGLISRIVANLVDNALEAAVEIDNPWVKVEHVRQPNRDVLSVINNGRTLSEEEMGHMFEPGFSSKSEAGHGWGLPICQKAARELGGEVVCESRCGITRFSLIIPGKG